MTKNSGLIERASFLAYSGCVESADCGSFSCESFLGSAATISGVRRTT